VSRTQPQSTEFKLESGPFCLNDGSAYRRWRRYKLSNYPLSAQPPRAIISRLSRLDTRQRELLVSACRRTNFALYQTDPETPPTIEELRAFGEQLGLVHLDQHLWAQEAGIVALRKHSDSRRANYIPYTDRPMKWHTDGYYNATEAVVRGIIMHCVTPAAEGGANWLLDPEMVYIAMRDADPSFIEALMQPDAMTIPENTQEPGAHRAAVSGPVFSVDPACGGLHMRYTARQRSIRWKDDAATRAAVAFLEDLLAPPVAYALRVCLQAGEGIVSNNVLHNREAFNDDPGAEQQRFIWRARYRNRILDSHASQAATASQRVLN